LGKKAEFPVTKVWSGFAFLLFGFDNANFLKIEARGQLYPALGYNNV